MYARVEEYNLSEEGITYKTKRAIHLHQISARVPVPRCLSAIILNLNKYESRTAHLFPTFASYPAGHVITSVGKVSPSHV